TARTPTGAGQGQRSAKKSRHVSREAGIQAVTEGASTAVCEALGIPPEWARYCEDSAHTGHDGTTGALARRLEWILAQGRIRNFTDKMQQLGSYGGGNHFGECETVQLCDDPGVRRAAQVFGLKDRNVAFLSHCGSRGFGNLLAQSQFHDLERKFAEWGTPFPAMDKKLVYAPLGTPEADAYLDDMALGSNFATVNHLLINALVLEAFQEVLPGVTGRLVYFISHNIARQEVVDNRLAWVHRKGATRAVPAGHHSLAGTPFAETGHPILLPGNPRDGSVVMVAQSGAAKSCWSVNHGAGRAMGRREAGRRLDQKTVDAEMDRLDIMSNCRRYPIDESPDAYKDFTEVLNSVEQAGLAKPVARLKARFVIKDGDKADD
ncbi:MAG: RtcB family protein, partial [Verrucomicrobiaceae bacterium]